jgi:branched-chain amino acid transport system permease protein
MSVAEQPLGAFAADLDEPARSRVPDWALNTITGWLWLAVEVIFFLAGLPLVDVAFHVVGALAVLLDRPRRTTGSWLWAAATLVVGPLAFLPYTYARHRRESGLDALVAKWLPDGAPARARRGLEALLHPITGWAWVCAVALAAIVTAYSVTGGATMFTALGILALVTAIAVVLDHGRASGASILWGLGTLVLGPLVFLPYSYRRRSQERVRSARSPQLALGAPRPAVGVAFLALALAYPYLIPQILGASGVDLLDASVNSLAYVIMALGLNIVVGFAGLLDLGYVAFFAIGAFVMGWLGSGFFEQVNGGKGIHVVVSSFAGSLPGIHLNFVLIVCLAAAFTAVWGAILGAPTLRLRGDYLAIVTLAFGEIVPRVFELSTSGPFGIGHLDISNGRQGITPVDKIYFPGVGSLQYPLALIGVYFVALAMVLVTLFVNVRLRDSRLGRAWIAVREDEVAASSMGVNLVRTKLWAYSVGAAFGGFSGAFLGTYKNTVNVDQFEFGFSVFILCMVILGGMGNTWGVILGAIALSMADRFALPFINQHIHLGFDLTAINFGIFGFFLLIMMVLRPAGMLPSGRRRLELEGGEVSDEQLYEVRA